MHLWFLVSRSHARARAHKHTHTHIHTQLLRIGHQNNNVDALYKLPRVRPSSFINYSNILLQIMICFLNIVEYFFKMDPKDGGRSGQVMDCSGSG
jgi:hypothetical protein